MKSVAGHDTEKAAAVDPIKLHPTTDNSINCNGEDDRPHPVTSEGKIGYWGVKVEAIWGVEARGITRVMTHEKNVPRRLHDYFHMFSLWLSINLRVVNFIIGRLGPLVYDLSWVDCVCIVIFRMRLHCVELRTWLPLGRKVVTGPCYGFSYVIICVS